MKESKTMHKIDLGCGSAKKKGYIGIDKRKADGVDLYADLEDGIPYQDNTVAEIHARHILEHIKNPQLLVDEIYRVCMNGANVEIIVPLQFPDPAHRVILMGQKSNEFWVKKYIRDNRFVINEYKEEEIISHADVLGEFKYIQATLTCEVKKGRSI